MKRVSIRWTIGDVNISGFEALRLSISGMWKIFGEQAGYTVCVNTIDIDEAKERTGPVKADVKWIKSELENIPDFIKNSLHENMAEGVAWKFSPLRINSELHEISLDNDCIIWEMPRIFQEWLNNEKNSCIIAADVKGCFGQFSDLCGSEGKNTGIRGIPPDYNLEDALKNILELKNVKLKSELDEQGLQVAALMTAGSLMVVPTQEVSICSPFPEHQNKFGTSGAHFVGLNAKSLPWDFYGKPAVECIQENWNEKKEMIYDLIDIVK